MTVIIHAIFDQADHARKGALDLQAEKITAAKVAVGEAGAREAAFVLDQHGVSEQDAGRYGAVISDGGAFLWARIPPDRQTEIEALLREDGASEVRTVTLNSDADELGEADGWEMLNEHDNEHSPNFGVESMWTDKNGNIR